MDDYTSSILVFVFITVIVTLICVYCYVIIRSESIKRDWMNQRCNPNIIPFAGMINKPDNMTASEYTSENFRYCTQSILDNVSKTATSPFTDILSYLTNLTSDFTTSMNDARKISSTVRNNMGDNTNIVMDKVQSSITPLQPIFQAVKTVFVKTNSVMTTFLYAINGVYLTLKSLLGSVAELCVKSLISMAVAVLALWAIAVFALPVAYIAGIATVIYAGLASMLVPLLIFMKSASTVKTNVCFDESVEITMNNGDIKRMVNIQVGDILFDSNVVTAKLKLSASGAKMYKLKGVIVSDSHTVKYKDTWVHVSEHPEAVKIYNYREPYIYCLNTSSKQIQINDICFADWDEIYTSTQIDNLKTNAGLSSSDVIHKSLDSGFIGNTYIQLRDGTMKHICNVQIGDILQEGGQVYGLVEIKGDDLQQYKYNFGNDAFIIGGPNLTICDPNIEITSTIRMNHTTKESMDFPQPILYHLLTDTQKINCGGITFYDYNGTIDLFLDATREKLLSMKYV